VIVCQPIQSTAPSVKPLECRGNYTATSNNTKFVQGLLMGGLLHWYSEEGNPLLVTAHPSTASVPIAVLMYNGPLLCSFNCPLKGSHCSSAPSNILVFFFGLRCPESDDDQGQSGTEGHKE